MTQFTSSVVKYGSYNPENQELTLDLLGKEYVYFNVPQEIWDNLVKASSQGAYFNWAIKNQFSFQAN